MYGFRADFVRIPYRCMYEFRADFVWKSYSNLVWKVVAKSHTFPINFPHLQLVHFPYESRTPLFTGYACNNDRWTGNCNHYKMMISKFAILKIIAPSAYVKQKKTF